MKDIGKNFVFNLGFICVIVLGVTMTAMVYADTASTQANIGNAGPQASSVTIAAGNLVSDEISLTANQTTQINITAVITDDNGCTDLTGVNATLFRTNITDGTFASDNNRTHYSMDCYVQSGECTGDEDTSATYDCNVNVSWYADPTDSGAALTDTNWTVNVTPFDGDGVGTSGTAVHDLRTTTSLALIESSIDFGSFSLGQNTTDTNQNVTIFNLGNERFDISLRGYGTDNYDNISMNCTQGTVPIHFLEYSADPFTYGSGTGLANASTELDFDLDRGNETTERQSDFTFFGFKIPDDGVGGTCSGNVVIVATSDPLFD